MKLLILLTLCRRTKPRQELWLQIHRDVGQVAHQRRQRLLRHCARDPQIQQGNVVVHRRSLGRPGLQRHPKDGRRGRCRQQGWLLRVHRNVEAVIRCRGRCRRCRCRRMPPVAPPPRKIPTAARDGSPTPRGKRYDTISTYCPFNFAAEMSPSLDRTFSSPPPLSLGSPHVHVHVHATSTLAACTASTPLSLPLSKYLDSPISSSYFPVLAYLTIAR